MIKIRDKGKGKNKGISTNTKINTNVNKNTYKTIINLNYRRKPMSRFINSLILLVILIILIFSNIFPLMSYAVDSNTNTNIDIDEDINIDINNIDINNLDNKKEIDSEFFVKSEDYLNESIEDGFIPTRYEYGINDNIIVHEPMQDFLNICWAFAQAKMIETSIAKQLNQNVEISKRHIDYMASNAVSDNPYQINRKLGGTFISGFTSYNYQFSGAGFVAEDQMPYNTSLENKTYSEFENMKKQPYMTSGVKFFSNIQKDKINGRIKYTSYSKPNQELTTNEVNNIRNEIKIHVQNKGGIIANVHLPVNLINNEKHMGNKGFDTLYIDSASSQGINHSVVIVGWDDNYPKENFKDPYNGTSPSTDGAWIISDSNYGTSYNWKNNYRRFYVSYEDKLIESVSPVGIEEIKNIPIDLMPNIYQHEVWGGNWQSSLASNRLTELEFCNVYKHNKSLNSTEGISSIIVESNEPAQVYVKHIPRIPSGENITTYINNYNHPTDYQLVGSITSPGIFKMPLNKETYKITANDGEHFAIKVKLVSSQGYLNSLPLTVKSTSFPFSPAQSIRNNYAKLIEFGRNQSYIKARSLTGQNSFIDLYNTETDGYKINLVSNEKSYPLKVYTESLENVTVRFNLDGGNINGKTEDVIKVIQKGKSPKHIQEPVKLGYIFKGWDKDINAGITENTIYTALWEKAELPKFNVSFNLLGGYINGQTKIEPQIVEQGKLATNPGIPQKTGYNFSGWEPSIKTPIMNDTIFTALWEVQPLLKHTVSFNLNGGNINGQTNIPNQEVVNGEKVRSPGIPKQEGKVFIGWSPDINEPIKGYTLFTAQWENSPINHEEYLVSFDLKGGSGNISPQMVKKGELIMPVSEPKKEGYVFTGWTPSTSTPINSNTIFVAGWRPLYCSYVLKFAPLDKNDVVGKVEYGQKIPPQPIPKLEGYRFEGWMPDINKPLTEELNQFIAKWTKMHKVTFYNHDGTVFKQTEVANGEKIQEDIGTPTAEGYKFLGWESSYSSNIYSDIDIKGIWVPIEHIVTFNLDGGNILGKEYVNSQRVQYGKTPYSPGTPVKNGYKFLGWNPSIDLPVKENTEYIALWEENILPEYEVSFNLNGGNIDGEESLPMQKVKEGSKAVSPGIPKKEGYYFEGWSPDITTEIIKDIEFTALWTTESKEQKREFKATFNFNMGEKYPSITKNVFEGQTPTIPDIPKREGYVFERWDNDPTIGMNKDVIYTAIWKKEKYTLIFYTDANTIYKKAEVKIGEIFDLTSIDEPILEGKKFLGWTHDLYEPIEKDYKIHARWAEENEEIVLVAFDLNGGNINGRQNVNVRRVIKGGKVDNPGKPVNIGYVFTGWSPEITKPIFTDIIIKANWERKDFNVKFVSSEDNTIIYKEVVKKAGEKLTSEDLESLLSITKPGYFLAGWSEDLTLPIYENLEIHPIWEREQNLLYVKFDLNGGNINGVTGILQSGAIANKPVRPPSRPEKKGYIFKGWDPDLNEPLKENGKIFTAKWISLNDIEIPTIRPENLPPDENEEKPSTPEETTPNPENIIVSFILNGGEGEIPSQVIKKGEKAEIPKDPIRNGYIFYGWSPDITKDLNSNTVFYAIWKPEYCTYTIKFTPVQRSDIINKVPYNTPPNMPEINDTEEYIFTGWSIDVTKPLTEEHTIIYAKWEKKEISNNVNDNDYNNYNNSSNSNSSNSNNNYENPSNKITSPNNNINNSWQTPISPHTINPNQYINNKGSSNNNNSNNNLKIEDLKDNNVRNTNSLEGDVPFAGKTKITKYIVVLFLLVIIFGYKVYFKDKRKINKNKYRNEYKNIY